MTPRMLVRRVALDSALAVALLAVAAAAWLGTSGGPLGILLGGGLAVGNLWWMAGHAAPSAGLPHPAILFLSVIVRFLLLTAAVAAIFAVGRAHPIGVVVGLTVVPLVLILRGLTAGGKA